MPTLKPPRGACSRRSSVRSFLLSSWRANNAFLFSVRDSRNKLQFGIQLLPGKVVVYTAEKTSVYFTYDVHDGRQHSFAVGVRPRSVSFHADCGAVQQREQTLTRSQTLGSGSGGLLTLGRMNSKAAQFQGLICQLDIYPLAQAAARYCDYLKRQCRLADTFRWPPSSDMEPHLGVRIQTQSSLLEHLNSIHTPVTAGHSSLSSGTLSGLEALGITRRSTTPSYRSSSTRGSTRHSPQSENDMEERSPRRPQRVTIDTPGINSPVKQTHLKDGLRNSSSSRPRDSNPQLQPIDHLLDTQFRPNGTTLYRENQVETSEEHGKEEAYDVDMGGYDYGYEDPDYFYGDYDEAFPGPKGEPGPPVSVWNS
ncbi:unnamed protein product [Oncorhynchus mykiss]|uniref:Laminin G domain-containing protein n=1 Tax=Oncorhynchus mykiss TaxID=8022 RepID=A0A060W8J0_ONCMY|nr:unnamed protein product [Oncorhynchus mykiss]